MRLKTENDKLQQETALLQEQIRIKDARMMLIMLRRRPHYPAVERRSILEQRAARGWSLQQTAADFKRWLGRKRIKPRYGAIGQHGGISVIERFVHTMKDEATRRIVVPTNHDTMRREIRYFSEWYNESRPHSALGSRTPNEIYDAIDPIADHSDPWTSFCANTRRTARSRTSGEYLFVSFITPYPQTTEAPVNPELFRCVHIHVHVSPYSGIVSLYDRTRILRQIPKEKKQERGAIRACGSCR